MTTEASEEEEGTVISQDPEPGSTAEKGSAINVVVSDGSLAKAIVPYLVGQSLSDAQAALLTPDSRWGASAMTTATLMPKARSCGSSMTPTPSWREERQ